MIRSFLDLKTEEFFPFIWFSSRSSDLFLVKTKQKKLLNQTYPTRSPWLNMSSSSVNSTSNQRKTFWLAALIIPNLLKRNLKPGIREREISTNTKDKQKVKYDIPPTNLAGPQVVLYYLLTKKNMKRKKVKVNTKQSSIFFFVQRSPN